jgi:type I restriction enzyme M protein
MRFSDRQDEEYFSRLVDHSEIASNKYSLSVSNYIKPEDTREIVDIDELNQRIIEIVTRHSVLRSEIDLIVKDLQG